MASHAAVAPRAFPTARTERVAAGAEALPARKMLTLFVIILIAIPSRLTVGALGSAGTPAQLLGVLFLSWWGIARVTALAHWRGGRQPIRVAAYVLGGAILASFVCASARPMAGVESRAAEVGLLNICGWFGILLFAMDGLATRRDLDTILRRLACAGGALATLGVVQFATKRSFTNYIHIPGLSTNGALVSVYSRSGFARPAGTALHPIEFGAVLTICLPIALHFALHDRERSVVRRWYPVLVIAFATAISISRSALLSSAIVLLIMLPAMPVRTRRRLYVGLFFLGGMMFVLVPGLLGSLVKLFSNFSGDSDTLSRTESYRLAGQFIARNPIFGRGFGTFLPQYRILDNAYLGALIELGAVGLTALFAFFATCAGTAWTVFKRAQTDEERSLGIALVAAVGSFFASAALFDAFSFPMAAGTVFLLCGLAGALYRLSGTAAGTGWVTQRVGSLDSTS